MTAIRQIKALPAIACFAAFSTVCAAQLNNPSVFAMSLHDSLSQLESQTRAITSSFESPYSDRENGTFILLLNSDQDADVAFDAMGPQGGFDNASRGRNLNGIDAGRFIEPKEDNLTVVPLPGAAIAGFALLAGVAGVRLIRKSR